MFTQCTIVITVLLVPLFPVCKCKGVTGDMFCKYCGVTMVQPCQFPCSIPFEHQYHDNTSFCSPNSSPSMSCHLFIFLKCILYKLVWVITINCSTEHADHSNTCLGARMFKMPEKVYCWRQALLLMWWPCCVSQT